MWLFYNRKLRRFTSETLTYSGFHSLISDCLLIYVKINLNLKLNTSTFSKPILTIYLCDCSQTSCLKTNNILIGCSPFLKMTGMYLKNSQMASAISVVRSKKAEQLDIVTGNSWLLPHEVYEETGSSNASVETPVMLNRQDPMLLTPMSGKKTPELPGRNSNLEPSGYEEIHLWTGIPSGKMLNVEGWSLYRQTSTLDVTASCERSLWIIYDLLGSNEKLLCSGVQLDLVNQEEHGLKLAKMHIQKVTSKPNNYPY